jgi:hypothetical protein
LCSERVYGSNCMIRAAVINKKNVKVVI